MLKCFAEKMWVAFAVQKLLTFFQQKISEYCILTTKTVNEMTLNELVKLTTLWTTGPWSLRNVTIPTLDRPKCWPFHIFIEYQENKQPHKISERKIYAYTGTSEKWGLSHTNQEKSGQSYTFCWKKEAYYIPGSAEKGGHSARTSVLCHIYHI